MVYNSAATLRERMFSFDEHGVTFSRGRVAERQARGRRLIIRRKKGQGQNPNCTRTKNSANTRGGKRIQLAVTICNGASHWLNANQNYTNVELNSNFKLEICKP